MMWEFKGLEALSTSGNIAIVGTVAESDKTEGAIKHFIKKFTKLVIVFNGFLIQRQKKQ